MSTMRFTFQLFNYKQWIIQTKKNKECETFFAFIFCIFFSKFDTWDKIKYKGNTNAALDFLSQAAINQNIKLGWNTIKMQVLADYLLLLHKSPIKINKISMIFVACTQMNKTKKTYLG